MRSYIASADDDLPWAASAAITRRSDSSSYGVLVERLLGSLDAGGEVPGRERGARDEVPGSRTEPLDRATVLRRPRLVVERGMSEQRPGGGGRGQSRRRLVLVQTAIRFGFELGRGGRDQPSPRAARTRHRRG